LPGLIEDAQIATENLNQVITVINAAFLDNWVHSWSVMHKAYSEEGFDISTGNIESQVQSTYASFKKYIDEQLIIPDCNPDESSGCGYYHEVMKLTVHTDVSGIYSLGSEADALSVLMKPILDTLPGIADSIEAFLQSVQNTYNAHGKNYSQAQVDTVNIAAGDARRIRDTYTSQLNGLADRASETGRTLYTHYIKS